MKKILHISKYYYPFRGGTEQIARDIVMSLQDEYEQKVICFNHVKGDSIDYIDDIEVIRCGCFAKLASQSLSASYSRILKNTISEFAPDIIVFHYPNPFAAYLLLKYIKPNMKLVVYWHLDIVKQKMLGKFFVHQNNVLVRRADRLIATSPNYVDGSKYLCKEKNKCVVIPNCINENRIRVTDEIRRKAIEIKKVYEGKILCVAVGRHTQYKGFNYLIDASKLLDDSYEIVLIGSGELTRELKQQAQGDKKIHFLGTVTDDELKAYLCAMDIFCFPSFTKNEAFGLALAEAMYYEKPAVTFTIAGSGVNYVCINGEDGIEVVNGNTEAYATAIKKLGNDRELREKYGRQGKKRVEDLFLFKEFEKTIRRCMGEL